MDSKKPSENQGTQDGKRESNIQTKHPNPGIALGASPSELPPPHAHYDVTCHTEKDWWDKHKRWAELLGLIILAIYTTYTIKMYCANKRAADAATSAADTANRSLIETNRSWIEFSLDESPQKPTKSIEQLLAQLTEFSFLLNVKNIGRFPIRGIHMEGSVELPNSNEPVSHDRFFGNLHGKAGMNILYPERSTKFTATWFQKSRNGGLQPVEISEPDRKELLAGSKYIMVYARATFDDGFGKHWVEFCEPFIFEQTRSWKLAYKYGDCITYNDAGDGDPPWKEVWP
jgi:hypothetical protein